jgi:chemotaxis protein MotB
MAKIRNRNTYQIKEGAWKLAYADFVTAMMCFFMLMWLLNSTPSNKLKSIASYFKPTIGLFAKTGEIKGSEKEEAPQPGTEDNQNDSQDKSLISLETRIKADLVKNPSFNELSSNIAMSIKDDGLEISILDQNRRPMFNKGSAELTPSAKLLVEKITRSILYTSNRIVIGGHTEKINGSSLSENSSWQLSGERADSVRQYMQLVGIAPERVARLISYSDNLPLDDGDPYSEKNRRITITVLNKSSDVKYKIPISKKALKLEASQ